MIETKQINAVVKFAEEFTALTTTGASAWVSRATGHNDAVVEIWVHKPAGVGVFDTGVRVVGSVLSKIIELDGSTGYNTLVQSDSSGNIEIYSDDVTVLFHVAGVLDFS